MPPKSMHGARALVQITGVDSATGQQFANTVGIWNQFSYQVAYDVQAVFILGRFSAAELVTTGVEPVVMTAQGFRVVDHGPFTEGKLTDLADLLNQEYIQLSVYDRQSKKNVATIKYCLPTGTSSTVSAKALQDSSNSYIGLLLGDEHGDSAEATDAAHLP